MLKLIIVQYIKSSLHVALAVFSLTWITIIEHNLEYNDAVLYTVFYSTIIGYNYIKYFELIWQKWLAISKELNLIIILTLTAALILPIYLFRLEQLSIYILAFLTLLIFLYAAPNGLKKILKFKSLRYIAGLKVFLIAFVWSIVTVVLPLVDADVKLNFDVFLEAFQRFVFVVILMIPFEIRDLNFDDLKLSTLPQKFGIITTKRLGYVLVLLFVLIPFFKNELSTKVLLLTFLIGLICMLFIKKASPNQSIYYSGFWVEAIPILWLLLYLWI